MSRNQRSAAEKTAQDHRWKVVCLATILAAWASTLGYSVWGISLLSGNVPRVGLFTLALAGFCATLGCLLLEHLASAESHKTRTLLTLAGVVVAFLASVLNQTASILATAIAMLFGIALTISGSVLNYHASAKAVVSDDMADASSGDATAAEELTIRQ